MSVSVEAVELLARRADLLAKLRGEPHTKPELADALSVSRSTVDRAVRRLEANGLVERGQAVSLTLRGVLSLDAYEEFADCIGALAAADPALAPLSPDATVDDVLFRDAEVVKPDRVTPQRAVERYRELIAEADRVRGFARALIDSTVPTFRDRIVEAGAPVELVVVPDVLDALVATHADTIAETRASGNLTLLSATTTLEYNLALVEHGDRTHACGLFYTRDGLTALVRNDAPDAVEWAEGVYESLRADAEPLHD